MGELVRTTYSVNRRLDRARFRELLHEVAPRFCCRFLFVVRPSLGRSARLHALLSRLQPSLLLRRRSSEWPGTQLLDGELVEVFEGELTSETANALVQAAGSLLSFRQPDLPEDLAFLRPDGSPWLISCTHEGDIYLDLSEAEAREVLQLAPWLLSLEQ